VRRTGRRFERSRSWVSSGAVRLATLRRGAAARAGRRFADARSSERGRRVALLRPPAHRRRPPPPSKPSVELWRWIILSPLSAGVLSLLSRASLSHRLDGRSSAALR
jgi:hypothetical protein